MLERTEQLEVANLVVPPVAKQRHCRARMQGRFQMPCKASLWESESGFLLFAVIKNNLDK